MHYHSKSQQLENLYDFYSSLVQTSAFFLIGDYSAFLSGYLNHQHPFSWMLGPLIIKIKGIENASTKISKQVWYWEGWSEWGG